MLYQTDRIVRATGRYREPYSRSVLPCYTRREMQALYPGGDYQIVGEIGVIAPRSSDGDTLLADNGAAIPICPRGSLKKPIEWVAGYIPLRGDAYAAAVASILPAVFLRIMAKKPEYPLHSQGGRVE